MTVLEVICAHLRQKSNLLLGVWIYNGGNGPPQRVEYPVFKREIRQMAPLQGKGLCSSGHVHVVGCHGYTTRY